MDRAAKVLWLTKGLGRGGAESLLVSSAPHFDRSRFDVQVAYVLPAKDAFATELRSTGMPVHCLASPSANGLSWLPALSRVMASQQFDLIHTHMPVPAAAARILTSPACRLVHTEHNVWQRYRRPTYWANALTFRRNDLVIAVSQAVADSIVRRHVLGGLPRIEVLHHGIDIRDQPRGPDAKRDARTLLGIPSHCFVVGTVGNLTPKKDQRTLIGAFASAGTALGDARLIVVGSGPLEDQLRAQAHHLGLSGKVVFTGTRNDVAHLLPAFDTFALSSIHEGLSLALVEGLAAGLPAIATAVGGVPEVVTNGVEGLLVEPKQPAAMAAALVRMRDDPEMRARMREAAFARARNFDIRRAVRRMEQLYDEVLERP